MALKSTAVFTGGGAMVEVLTVLVASARFM
jgi:hypothetical protein